MVNDEISGIKVNNIATVKYSVYIIKIKKIYLIYRKKTGILLSS